MSQADEITSMDCKILQYKYSIYKAEKCIEYLKSVSQPEPSQLRLCHYLTLLGGNLFAINEGTFNSKLDLISQYKLFRIPPINISPMVSHIPYDTNDLNASPLVTLPSVETSAKCVKLLLTLYTNCLQGYQKRLAQALVENKYSEEELQNYDDIIESLFGSGYDVDMVGSDDFSFQLTDDPTLMNDPTFIEATLIDIDIKMVFTIVKGIKQSLARLKVPIDKYKSLKTNPASLKQFKDKKYALHKVLVMTLRLNDLYVILRRFGRKSYLSNLNHLTDQKFLASTNQSSYFKTVILKSMDEIFNSAKKNGVLIATLTRLIRANSKFEVNVKNILDFNNFTGQGHFIISTMISKFEEFGNSWVSLELRFRKAYNLPKFYVSEIFDSVQREKLHLQLLAKEKEKEKDKQTTTQVQTARPSKPTEQFPQIDEAYIDRTKKLELSESGNPSRERSIFNRPSRSSSVSSNSSVSSASTKTSSSNLVPGVRNVSGRTSRPNSMIFLNANSSNSSLPKPAPPPATTTRRRSNSQPTSPESVRTQPPQLNVTSSPSNSAATSPLNSKIASSGAAAALKHNSGLSPSASKTQTYQQLSPSNSIKRKPSINRNSVSAKGSPNGKVHPIIEENETKKLSANQRLTQHLRQAAKEGALMTQEKEVFESVVFDPNDPSAINMRRQKERERREAERKDTASTAVSSISTASTNGSASDASSGLTLISSNTHKASENSAAPKPKRRTRDEVTKLNTKRNSELVTLSSNSSKPVSDSSGESTETSTSIVSPSVKQVRFIGVPEYTEAEDAPVSYSAKILKNFAVFKTPSKPGFKRKDQMLKKEESMSFKHLNNQNLMNNPRGIISPPVQGLDTPKTLSSSLQQTKFKIKSKLI